MSNIIRKPTYTDDVSPDLKFLEENGYPLMRDYAFAAIKVY